MGANKFKFHDIQHSGGDDTKGIKCFLSGVCAMCAPMEKKRKKRWDGTRRENVHHDVVPTQSRLYSSWHKDDDDDDVPHAGNTASSLT